MAMSVHRNDRINEEIKRELASVLRELKDPRIGSMVSVVAVEVTGDLRYCKAYVSVMGSDEEKKQALKGLKAAAGFIRREIAGRVQLRYTPEFIFEGDNSISHGAHIASLLNKIQKENEKQ
jgi:ribosome-binding factor A